MSSLTRKSKPVMNPGQTSIKKWLSKAFNLTQVNHSRLKWVDYVKGIAILLVVYRHVLIGLERSGLAIPSYMVNANMIFYSFRMPLFFILSGMFISSSLSKRPLNRLLYIKFESLLYPYFIWVFLQITVQILFSSFTNAERGLADYGYIFYQPRNLDQFWYLPALFNVTFFYLLIKTKLRPPASVQLLIGITLYFLSSYIHDFSMLSDWMEFYFFFALGDAVSQFFFKEKTQNFFKNPIVLIIAIPVFLLTQRYYLSNEEIYYLKEFSGKAEFIIISLIGCASMFFLAFRLESWNIFSFLRVIGFHSLFIYVMHVFAAAAIRIILMKVFHIFDPLLLTIAGIAFSITISIAFYNLLIKDNIFWFLFSIRKNKITPIANK